MAPRNSLISSSFLGTKDEQYAHQVNWSAKRKTCKWSSFHGNSRTSRAFSQSVIAIYPFSLLLELFPTVSFGAKEDHSVDRGVVFLVLQKHRSAATTCVGPLQIPHQDSQIFDFFLDTGCWARESWSLSWLAKWPWNGADHSHHLKSLSKIKVIQNIDYLSSLYQRGMFFRIQ